MRNNIKPIAVHSLHKRYGTFEAVRDVSFEVAAGSICGLLGPNGSGKSTTFKCMLGLTRADSGRITIAGSAPCPAMFDSLAFVPERSALYERLSGNDHIEMMRRAYRSFDGRRAQTMLEIFSLDPGKRVGRLSKGQRTALGLVLAFSIRPTIMIMDEPSSGLDPIHQRAVLDLIIEAAALGTAIVLSSHQIGQVERAADCVVVLKHGQVVLEGELDELRSREKMIEAVFAAPIDAAVFRTDPRIRRVEQRGITLRLYVHADPDGVMRDVNALAPVGIHLLDQNLEELFFSAVEQPRTPTLEGH